MPFACFVLFVVLIIGFVGCYALWLFCEATCDCGGLQCLRYAVFSSSWMRAVPFSLVMFFSKASCVFGYFCVCVVCVVTDG